MVLKGAVIGTGNMGYNHARAIFEAANIELVAIAEPNKENAEKVLSKYKTKHYNDYKEMLEKEDLDFVSICVPTKWHCEVAEKALEKCHVLLEKPITLTIEEGERLIKKAEKEKKHLMIGHIERFNPAVQYLKEFLKKTKEEILSMNFTRLGIAPPKNATTGVIEDLAIHDIDLFRYFSGNEILETQTFKKSFGYTNFEDHAQMFIKAKNMSASLIVNWINPRKVRTIDITMKKTYMEIELIEQKVHIYEVIEGLPYLSNMINIDLAKQEPLKLELQTFSDLIEGKIENPITGKDALETLKLAKKLSGGKND